MDPVERRDPTVAGGDTVVPATTTTTTPYSAPATVAPVAAGTAAYSSRGADNQVADRLVQLVWLIVGVVDIILALDFIFRAAGANHTSGFVHYIYRIGGWLAAPFEGIFGNATVNNGVSVLRWSDVVAVAIYTIAAWIVTRLVQITATPRTGVRTA